MTEERDVAPGEATEEAVHEVEQTEEQEGQAEGQPAEEEGKPEGEPDAEDKAKSASKERRERDKAYKARLREEKEAALNAAAAAEKRLERIKTAGQAEAEPKEKDFADYAEYAAAKALWMYSNKQASREQGEVSAEVEAARKEAQKLEEQERQLAIKAYAEAREEARTRYADFDAVVGQDGLFPTGTHLPDLVLQSDAPADVAYEIAKDRALHDMLLKASPVEAARIIGRIEAKVSAPPPKSKTNAPDPITPVRGPAAAGKDPSKMTQAEFNAWREAGGSY